MQMLILVLDGGRAGAGFRKQAVRFISSALGQRVVVSVSFICTSGSRQSAQLGRAAAHS